MPLGERKNLRGCGGAGTRGWMPPRQLVAAVPRWSRGVVGEGVGEGVGTRGWMPPRQLVTAVPLAAGPYFAVKGSKFLLLFRWKRVEISRKFRKNFEIFEISCARMCALVFNSPISLTRFPSQNEVPRFVPL